jgi:hypothetical protein
MQPSLLKTVYAEDMRLTKHVFTVPALCYLGLWRRKDVNVNNVNPGSVFIVKKSLH